MKKTILLSAAILLSTQALATSYKGSSFSEVWGQIESDPYVKLPQNKISYRSLFGFLESKIEIAANRTLSDRSDLLPQFTKLAHPNGVCLSGTWEITEENPYGGYFKKGSQALIIGRASVAMSDTVQGKDRGFALAGKLFPTNDSSKRVNTANFFLVDDLGGTKAPHYTGVEMLNEPAVSKTAAFFKNILYGIKLAVTFGKADSNPGMRQLYEISGLRGENLQKIRTPKWMKVGAREGQTIDERDFRDELNMANYPDGLIFDISVASKEVNGEKQWTKVGTITMEKSIASNSCDHRLHFHHPKWNSNLKH